MDYLGRRLGEEAASRLAVLLAGGRFRPDLIVPVPLHWWRGYRRGYNQALVLAVPFARATGLPLAPGLLRRPRAGRRQLGLSRRERLRSLESCYRARARAGRGGRAGSLAGRKVLLIDDVVTTGATLEACARALLRTGAASVTGCALARTPGISG